MPFAARIVATLTVCLAAQAHASLVTDSVEVDFRGSDSFNYTLDRFDASRGTLTGISLSVKGQVTAGVSVGTGQEDADGNEIFQFYKSLFLRFPGDIQFTSDGTFDRSFQVTSFAPYIGDTPFTFSGSNSGSGRFLAAITYTFEDRVTAVPLPASLPLVGLGLAALGLVRVLRPASPGLRARSSSRAVSRLR